MIIPWDCNGIVAVGVVLTGVIVGEAVTASVGGSIGEKVVGVVRLFIFAVDWTGVALAQAEKK